MTAGTRKPLFWIGLIFFVCIGLPLVLWGVGSALIWIANTYGLQIGARNV
jgi:hypothetical protein